MERKKTVLIPVRVTIEQNNFLKKQVEKGHFSSRQEAIRFLIAEKMRE